MIVNVIQTADDGSNFYRLASPAKAAADAGADVEVHQSGQEVRDADVWVLNRPSSRNFIEVVRNLVESGRAVVIDMDDSFSKVRPGHSLYGPKSKQVHDLAMEACELATVVTGSTPAVVEEYGFGKGVVLPNYVPESYFDIEPVKHDGVWVGWSGTVTSHPNDLQSTNGYVGKALKESGAKLAYVGPKQQAHFVSAALKFDGKMALSGWQTQENYPKVISQFDVGIVPLENCSFNDAKSWLKMLEFASTGVVPIGSPTQPNKALAASGVGMVTSNVSDWRRLINQLAKDHELRKEKAREYKEAARMFTIEKNYEKWIDVWELANSRRLCNALV